MTGPWGSLSQRTQDLGSLHGDGSVSVKFTQGLIITIPVAGVGFNKRFGCLATKHVFIDQFFHDFL